MRLRSGHLVLHRRVLVGTGTAPTDSAAEAPRLGPGRAIVVIASATCQMRGRRQPVRAHSGQADDERRNNLSAGKGVFP